MSVGIGQRTVKILLMEMASSSFLTYCNKELPVKSVCDASLVGFGSVVADVMDDGSEKPVMGNADALSRLPVGHPMFRK